MSRTIPTISPHRLRLALEAAWMKAGDRNTVGDHNAWLRRSKLVLAEYERLMNEDPKA